ncbi:MAG: type 1 glutamine amidotransferase [Gammaproteobacteria bacterium]|nr:type 1 glutamine amidotransferase [Gammaproteobacteria bacterium]MCY4274704.1 type 1 glutamine amidotransferase [Gammaproteobacteria bacterium]
MLHDLRILVFKHMSCQNPGIFRDYASQRNIHFEEIDLYHGDLIPNIRNFDALWVMGGSMNVWEEQKFPWLTQEKQAIRQAFNRDMPFFGICLGHQLLADSLGGQVIPSKHIEIGSFSIQPTSEGIGHKLFEKISHDILWANVHTAEVLTPPENALILANSSACSNHAMAVGDRAYSVQFHPEVCQSTMSGWLSIPNIVPTIINLLGKQGFNEFAESIEVNRANTQRAAAQLLDNWLSLAI